MPPQVKPRLFRAIRRRWRPAALLAMATLVSVLILQSGRRVPGTRAWKTTLSLPNVTYEEDEEFEEALQIQFQPLFPADSDFWVISAFLDQRPLLENIDSPLSIIVLGVGHREKMDAFGDLSCQVRFDDEQIFVSPARLTRYIDDRVIFDDATMLHCDLPYKPESVDWCPIIRSVKSVSFIRPADNTSSISLPVDHVDLNFCQRDESLVDAIDERLVENNCSANSTDPECHSFGMCISPIRGDKYASNVDEFLNHYIRLAGGSRILFMMYNASAGPKTSKVLNERSVQDDIRLLQWRTEHPEFPGFFADFNKVIWENGQTLMLLDCLNRLIGKVRWLGVVDLDEYIVGRCDGAESLIDIFRHATGSDRLSSDQFQDQPRWSSGPWPCSFSFRSAFFPLVCKQPHPVESIFDYVIRSDWFPVHDRSKYFVDTLRLGRPFVHYPKSYVGDVVPGSVQEVIVPVELAAVHHYRHDDRASDENPHLQTENCSEFTIQIFEDPHLDYLTTTTDIVDLSAYSQPMQQCS